MQGHPRKLNIWCRYIALCVRPLPLFPFASAFMNTQRRGRVAEEGRADVIVGKWHSHLYPLSSLMLLRPPSPFIDLTGTDDSDDPPLATPDSFDIDSYFAQPLLDQLHIAYALDDLPLAKILLLRITRGIQDITSRTDPRLESVTPEDFDAAFLPKGGLMSPQDEARLAERQQKEAENARKLGEILARERREQEERDRIEKEEKERLERERAWEGWVEGVWGKAKREMAEMKEFKKLARKRQEETELARRRQEEDRRRAIAERRRSHTAATAAAAPPKLLAAAPRISYAHLSPTRADSPSESAQPELLYTLPTIPKFSTQPKRLARAADPFLARAAPSIRQPASHPLPSHGQHSDDVDTDHSSLTSVSFQNVLTAMRGQLFQTDIPVLQKRDRSQRTLHAKSKPDDFAFSTSESETPNPLSRSYHSGSPSTATRQQKREVALLADLLESVEDETEAIDRLHHRRRTKPNGSTARSPRKQRRHPLRMMTSSSSTSTCATCAASPASPSASSSSSSVSRTGSWLSFMSSSSASATSTVLTSPSTSPPMKISIRTSGLFSTWLKNVGSQSTNLPIVEQCTCDTQDPPSAAHSFDSFRNQLIPVATEASPLPLDSGVLLTTSDSGANEPVIRTLSDAVSGRLSSSSSPSTASSLVRSMSHVLDVARSFQSAYMQAAVFAAVPNVSAFGGEWDREYEDRRVNSKKVTQDIPQKLRPVGSRAEKDEVAVFISTLKKGSLHYSESDAGETITGESFLLLVKCALFLMCGPSSTVPTGFRPRITHPELFPSDSSVQYIPLVPPYNLDNPPRTVLPNPLPFPIHFKPQRSLSGSPHRRLSADQFPFRSYSKRRPVSPPRYSMRRSRGSPPPPSKHSTNTPLPSIQPTPRARFVGNPVYLRLKAVQNSTGILVTDTQIIELVEEGVSIKGGVLSCGREKVLGTAFEEVGRSRLSVDVDVFHIRAATAAVLPVNSPIPWWQHQDQQMRWEDGNVRRGRSVVKG
ncbi:hypothetical protein D9757_002573 [Collybiopsis confluens]|uniref:Uncharacterized protein n=1 Tax=Collybiopsis confluens TaxID=2823264 RepID=A0A8H5HWH1_9AGAR|nr:hypothetical protein D9757_002573 [Collybiopsis confluens]